MGKILSGKDVAQTYKERMKLEIEQLAEDGKRIPHLIVVLVGAHPASVSYVKGKGKACAEVGMKNTLLEFAENISEDELIQEIIKLNHDNDVDGILVQLPLPNHIRKEEIVKNIDVSKDVDGFHPLNVGKMYLGEETFLPCTPKGIMALLKAAGCNISGKSAVVLGRSQLVGAPVAQLLLQENATVTICHSKTTNIKEYCRNADILIAAVGRMHFVQSDWIKEGAVIIDVGVNRGVDGKLYGDVDFENVKQHASIITPVPGGVGPMTITMLLENTLQAYKRREK
jgi:methylenetetrahydrofolate dehydrogenase (NADP+)/methenyltetrahydrofolate cyclohydrolase